jgi:DNA-binding MarR family transcriptional regulator
MNQKVVATVLIVAGIVLAVFVFMAKAREDSLINAYVQKTGSCYLDNGVCLHEGRDYSLYIGGGILSGALILLGIYLLLFERSAQLMLAHQERIATDLKAAKQSNEWNAFLAGFKPEEQLVLKAIREQDGIQQSTLRYRTGLSKTGLSLMLKELEKDGNITRKESGKTNEIFLRKKF